MLFVR